MTTMTRIAPFLLLATLFGCVQEGFTYDLQGEVLLPGDVQAELEYPALVQAHWNERTYNLALLCEAGDEVLYAFEDSWTFAEHVSYQGVSAGAEVITLDGPCDPDMDLTGLHPDEGQYVVPFDHATVFPDEVHGLGRERYREEAVLLVIDFGDAVVSER